MWRTGSFGAADWAPGCGSGKVGAIAGRCGRRPAEIGLRCALVVGVAALAAGCAHKPVYEAKALPEAERLAVREQVRGFAKTHCGTCHQSTRPTALPAALAIYDLDTENWSAPLTAARLKGGFPGRLNGRLDLAGRQVLRTFIESELALRQP